MKFKSITLQGFKSFPEKTTIEFHEGITSIVGPNGSGKSNITDAIRWVLGEQSAKTLRGAKMEDVIFNGTANRRALSYSEVTLVMDNSDAALDTPYEEVEVRRRLYRSGESEYALNKSKCRLKDIVELFMDSGIGRDGYSLVGQGRIDEVLSTKSEDRRNIFDEAAGIAKFRSRKEEADGKLLRTEQNLQRVQDIQREIELHLKPLETQAAKAKKSLELKSKLSELDKNRLFYEISEHKNNIIKQTDRFDIAKQNLLDKKLERDNFVAQNEKEKDELNRLNKEREEARLERDKFQDELKNIEFQLKLKADSVSSSEIREKELLADIEREQNRINKLKNEIAENSSGDIGISELQEAEKYFSDKENELSLKEKACAELGQEFKLCEEELSSIRNKLQAVQNEISSKENKIETIISFQNTLDEMQSSDKNKESELSRELEDLQKSFSAIEDEKKRIDDEIKNLSNKINENKINREEANQKKSLLISKLRDCEYRYKSLNELIENNTGFQQSVKSLLKYVKDHKVNFDKKDILGPLASLIKVEQKYEKAIDTALASNLQNIVVKSEKTASELIEILRREHLGRATFLPIDAINARPVERTIINQAEKINGFISLASDLVEIEQDLSICLTYRLGRIFVCQDMKSAQLLSKSLDRRYQIVTLEGDLIAAGGAITGGYKNKNSQSLGLLERQRERDEFLEQINLINVDLNKINELELNYLKIKEDISRKLDELLLAQSKNKSEYITIETKLNLARNEYKALIERMGNNDKERYDLEIAELRQEISDNKIACDDYQNLITKKQEQFDILFETKTKEDTELSKLRSSFEEARVNLTIFRTELKNKQTLIESKKEEADELGRLVFYKSEELSRLRADITRICEECDALKKSEAEFAVAFENKKQNFVKLDEEYKEAESSNADFLMKLSEYVNEQEGLQKECIRLETQLEQLKNRERDFLNELWESYELTYYDKDKFDISNFDLVGARKEIRDLKMELTKLGPVNENASKEYEELKERHEFISKQHEDIMAARVDLEQLINSISDEMRQHFESSFSFINEQFNDVFQELFGGGYAELVLSDGDVLEADIQIKVCPPGKKLQNMLLLSGGERCLAAIALLFAIQRLKPTAFCVLDEVEAALDDANIFRFTKYLQNYARKTQFIIVTHRKGTMESADRIYGVSMPEKGISKVLSLNLEDKNNFVS